MSYFCWSLNGQLKKRWGCRSSSSRMCPCSPIRSSCCNNLRSGGNARTWMPQTNMRETSPKEEQTQSPQECVQRLRPSGRRPRGATERSKPSGTRTARAQWGLKSSGDRSRELQKWIQVQGDTKVRDRNPRPSCPRPGARAQLNSSEVERSWFVLAGLGRHIDTLSYSGKNGIASLDVVLNSLVFTKTAGGLIQALVDAAF